MLTLNGNNFFFFDEDVSSVKIIPDSLEHGYLLVLNDDLRHGHALLRRIA